MRKAILLSLLLMLLWNVQAIAQDKVVSGKVTSSDDGSPLPGVSVAVKGTSKGVTTDGSGVYKVTVSGAATLTFSFIGYASQEAVVGNRTIIDVQLMSEASQLSEVVVTGYGSSMNKREVTGAISKVKGKDIENTPIQSFDRALQGRAAGVQVLSANGVPGGGVNVRIRGRGSITAGNNPLYIVDGVQINTTNDAGAAINSNPLTFLNPNEIESMEILKDAATAAIYGSQAANGVVLITTKRGKAGKTRFSANYYTGFVEPLKTLDVMNPAQFLKVRMEAYKNSNPTLTDAAIRRAILTTQLNFPADFTDEQIAALPNYDWQEATFRNGKIDNYEFSLSGGNEKTTFSSSFAYGKQDASVIGIDFNSLKGSLNLSHKASDKLSFDAKLNLSSANYNGGYSDANGTTAFGAGLYASPMILPFYPIYNPDGTYFGLRSSNDFMASPFNQNVIANAEYIDKTAKLNQLVGGITARYQILTNLSLNSTIGMDYRTTYTNSVQDARTGDGFADNGSATVFTAFNTNIQTSHTLNYNTLFAGKHSINALAGFEYRKDINEGIGASAKGFPTPDFRTINAAATPTAATGFWTGYKRASVFGSVKYDYDKKYFATVTVRRDGSSRFGSASRFGTFPGITAGWLISEESFLKNSRVISELKIRGSWGETGNDQIGNFDSRSLYGAGEIYTGLAGIAPSGLGNNNLRWERNQTTDLGLDYGFFNNRIRGSFGVFDKRSKDLLLLQPVPQTSGYTNITTNVGEVQNRGFEAEITTVNFDLNGFKWETSFNFTALDNKVIKLVGQDSVLAGDLTVRIGYPIGTNVFAPWAGVNPATGRPMWYDINGNITYQPKTSDQRPIGSSGLSTMYGGLTNTISYKGIELSAFFQYDYGRVILNDLGLRVAQNGGANRNGLVSLYEERWTTPGQLTAVPRPTDGTAEVRGTGYLSAVRFLEDASYIRLKSVSLTYNINNNWIKSLKLSNLKLYAQAFNLITWTKWTGYDPEFVNLGAGNQGIVPQSRNYTAGIKLDF